MKDIFSIKGKVALVTGAQGYRKHDRSRLFILRAKVYISSRKADACDETAKKLSEEYGGECILIPADVSNVEGIEALADAIKAKEDKLDILINNAGVAWGEPITLILKWDKVMDTNVKGIFFLTQKLLPLLREAGKTDPSRVINIGSIDGLKKGAFENFVYGPSKAAVHHLSRVLAAFLIKEKIIVNAIASSLPDLDVGTEWLAATPMWIGVR